MKKGQLPLSPGNKGNDKELDVSGKKIKSTVSIGIAGYPQNGTDIQELTNKADKAMYKSKGEGKNKVTIFEEERNP